MFGARGIARRARESGGAVLVLVALMLPVLIGAGGLVVDVGNWFAHKRHLQLEADAGALAGAGKFTIACNWSAIQTEAGRFSSVETAGPSWNPQMGNTPAANLHRMMNSPTFYNQPSPVDSTVVAGDPCTNGSPMVDVKLTETGLPWFLKLANVDNINAQARVEIQQKVAAAGSLPIGVPDVGPKRARAFFVDESNGTVLASTTLLKTGTVGGLAIWSNSAAPVSVPISASHIGVRILLSGSASTTPQCGDVLVDCYGAGPSSAAAPVAGTPGLVHIRGYSSSTPAGTATAPQDRDVRLSGGTCEDGYFTVSNPCTVNVSAIVDFGTNAPPDLSTTRVSALVSGANASTRVDLTPPATITGAWTGGQIPIPAGSGATSVELRWQTGCPTDRTRNCNTTLGVLGNVQRAYAGSEALNVSGPIKQLLISENGNTGANSFVRDGNSHNLVVTLGLKPSLQNAASVNDPIVSLKIVAGGGSQNQALDCENRSTINFEDELTTGCSRKYKVNDGQACPADKNALAATAEPWNCTVVNTGASVGQLVHGMNARIIGDRNAGVGQCTAQFQNHWSSFPNLPAGDRRVVQVILAPFGSFNGNGSGVVPVTGFATFYVTGWDSSPCRTLGDDPAGNGELVGHFIKYVDTINNGGGGGGFCDLNAFGSCVAVMTR